ncbi:SPOSA6832_02102 [Sporobolomyces salmonicolor]|uniref:SPOSA6832_02102-mRNA-1:cds n=1 Tax=Sporidiobolus salmonicolor TaxID=5005 RepID=A0A0D6ELH3_SPOSA|nr:SPOSA6832_02102 [Sporobolomyces salmonicolor]
MVLSLRSRKDTLSIALLEDTLFLSPPPPSLASSLASASSRPSSDTTPRQSEPSHDPILRGQISLVCHAPRKARRISVELVGRATRHGGDGSHSYESSATLEKSLEIDLGGEQLERGTHTSAGREPPGRKNAGRWDFSFIIPSTTAVGERSNFGTVRHLEHRLPGLNRLDHRFFSTVRATLCGFGSFRDLSSMPQALYLIANPAQAGELPSGLEIDVRHPGSLSSSSMPGEFDLGPIALHVSSPHLTVASLLFLSVTFERPPEGLKVMSVSAFVAQEFEIYYSNPEVPTSRPSKQKKLLFYVDSTSPIPSSTEDLLDRPNLSRGTLPPLAYEPRAFLPQPLARLERSKEWTYARVTRIPDDDSVRPTTLEGTDTPIRVKHQLVVQIRYRFKGSKKDLVLEMASKVTIASCCCLQASLLLPRYCTRSGAPPSSSRSRHPSLPSDSHLGGPHSMLFPTADGPLTPFHRRCLCNTPLQALVDQEGEKLCGAATSRSRSRESRGQSQERTGAGSPTASEDAREEGGAAATRRGRERGRGARKLAETSSAAGGSWEAQARALRPAPAGPMRFGRSLERVSGGPRGKALYVVV